MARVTGFERQNLHQSKPHPTETECEYAFFEHAGQRYLQISSSVPRIARRQAVAQRRRISST